MGSPVSGIQVSLGGTYICYISVFSWGLHQWPIREILRLGYMIALIGIQAYGPLPAPEKLEGHVKSGVALETGFQTFVVPQHISVFRCVFPIRGIRFWFLPATFEVK